MIIHFPKLIPPPPSAHPPSLLFFSLAMQILRLKVVKIRDYTKSIRHIRRSPALDRGGEEEDVNTGSSSWGRGWLKGKGGRRARGAQASNPAGTPLRGAAQCLIDAAGCAGAFAHYAP